MLKFDIPTINDGYEGFEIIINLNNKILGSMNKELYGNKIKFCFEKCKYLRQNAIAFLGGISTFLTKQGFKVYYDFHHMPANIQSILDNAGIMSGHFGNEIKVNYSKEYITFKNFSGNLREDSKLSTSIQNYIGNEWLNDDRILLTPRLKKDLSARMYELFANALEHSNSELGCFTCGNVYTPQEETEIVLTIVDLGVGIVKSVQNFFSKIKEDIQEKDAMRWAFEDGNTTRPDRSGGLGLNLVYEFLNISNGTMDVYCNNIFLRIENTKSTITFMKSNFSGTMINIRIRQKNHTISGYTEELNDLTMGGKN